MDIKSQKQHLRERYLVVRKKLTEEEVAIKNRAIFEKITALPVLKDAKTVGVYLPINNEVDTTQLINYLFGESKKVYVPAFKNNSWKFVALKSGQMFEEGPLGILQPVGDAPINANNLDVAIFPGVAFDRRGVRLGYGMGVYDKLLSNSSAIKIGVGYSFQLVDNLPKEEHDLLMDFIVTDSETITLV